MRKKARSLAAWMYGPEHVPLGAHLWRRHQDKRDHRRWRRQILDPRNWR